ncbi:MAG: hypothetical protein ABI624_03520, partial [Casimicrobiaceae bacterium]
TAATALSAAAAAMAASSVSDSVSGIAGLVGDLGGAALAFAADGTDFARGGPTVVGERGMEVVNLPRGSRVTPNNMLGGGNTRLTTINFQSPVPADQRTQRQMALQITRGLNGHASRG